MREWWLDYCTGCGSSTASRPARRAGQPDQPGVRRRRHGQGPARLLVRPASAAPQQGSDDGSYALGPVVGAAQHDAVHRRHPGHLGDAGVRGAVHRATRRPPASATSATTSAASTATTWPTTCTRAGCSWAPSSRSTGCTPTTATGCRGTTAPRRTPARSGSCGCARRWCRTPTRSPRQANTTGVPIIRPLYLDYPTQTPRRTRTPRSTCTATTSWSRRSPRPNDANGNGSVSAVDPAGHLDRLLHRHHLHRPEHRHHHRPALADAGADQERRHHADPHRLRRQRRRRAR